MQSKTNKPGDLPESDALPIQSVQIALDVLEAAARAQGDVGVTEMAAQVGYSKATVFRHLHTLAERGYLARNPVTARYRLGAKAYLLGRMALDRFDLIAAAEATLKDLRSELKQTVTLGAVGPDGVTILETVLSQSELEIGVRPGSTMRFHSTAQGKIALAFTAQPYMDAIRKDPLERFTEYTICDIRQIESEVGLARERGWATASQEMILGINAIAAPILNETGDCIATLAIVGSVQFIRATPDPAQIEALQSAARMISRNLGYDAQHAP